jgi:hypothetical protein
MKRTIRLLMCAAIVLATLAVPRSPVRADDTEDYINQIYQQQQDLDTYLQQMQDTQDYINQIYQDQQQRDDYLNSIWQSMQQPGPADPGQ